jgi:hypothetical protein
MGGVVRAGLHAGFAEVEVDARLTAVAKSDDRRSVTAIALDSEMNVLAVFVGEIELLRHLRVNATSQRVNVYEDQIESMDRNANACGNQSHCSLR